VSLTAFDAADRRATVAADVEAFLRGGGSVDPLPGVGERREAPPVPSSLMLTKEREWTIVQARRAALRRTALEPGALPPQRDGRRARIERRRIEARRTVRKLDRALFQRRVKAAREARELSMRGAAGALGLPHSAWRFEGGVMARAERPYSLCLMLGVSADWLLGLTDKGGPENG